MFELLTFSCYFRSWQKTIMNININTFFSCACFCFSRTLNGNGVPNMSMYRPSFGQPFPRTAPFPSLFPPASAAAVAAAAAIGGTSSFPHNVSSPLPASNGNFTPHSVLCDGLVKFLSPFLLACRSDFPFALSLFLRRRGDNHKKPLQPSTSVPQQLHFLITMLAKCPLFTVTSSKPEKT